MGLESIIGGVTGIIGASSASDAADAQAAAAAQQLALQEQIYNDQKELFSPFYNTGVTANAAANSLLGLGPAPMIGGTAPEIKTVTVNNGGTATPGGYANGEWQAPPYAGVSTQGNGNHAPGIGMQATGPTSTTQYEVGGQTFATLEEAQAWANANPVGGTEYGGFQASPGYQFQLDQGLSAIDASASAGGGLYSGATMQAAQGYGQGLANQEFNNYYNQVAGQAGAGQAAAGQTAQAGQNYATGASNALANMGNAQAAGSIGVGNALMGGINNGLGIYQYQNSLNAPSQPLFGSASASPQYGTSPSATWGHGGLY